ncbi:MAG: glycoside hydrolase family 15 protein [Firmicutes bacterium]|nr:glycoside hydrolase family 15 protein [Bacillota bacterium]
MARDIPIGNGNMLVAFNHLYQICDWYFPLVGQENHTAGHPFRLGIMWQHQFSWVDDAAWERRLRYQERTLATDVTLAHAGWGVTVRVTDFVDVHDNILLRRFEWQNPRAEPAALRIFFHHDFHLYGVDVGDTVFYDPMTQALVHYKGHRYFLMSGQVGEAVGVSEWAIGRKEVGGMEGTWRDAEDGRLEQNAIAQGSVDSTYALTLELDAGQTGVLWAWVCAGQSLEEVRQLNSVVAFETPGALLDRTEAVWRLWLKKKRVSLAEADPFEPLYDRSLLILRTNVDNRGGILAANDSDIMHHSRDTYSYVWPRDGAWVARALDVAGYPTLSARFFAFAADVLDPGGYFLHKYNPDRSLASSWHPWWMEGRPELPIQEDETGVVLWALWQHFVDWRDVEVVEPWLNRLVFEAGQFLADYRHPKTGLPWPSWDLWEERRGIHAYTVAAVYAGLTAASRFARAFGARERAASFQRAADEVNAAFFQYFWDQAENRFLRRLVPSVDAPDTFQTDATADASLLLLPQLGLVDPGDPRMRQTARWVRERLWVPTAVGGLARYENDSYQRDPRHMALPGNPWFLCTLWYADYVMMTASTVDELQPASQLLAWAADHARASGVMAEQLDPERGTPVSVSPLTWSHAAFVLSLARYREALAKLTPQTARGEDWGVERIGW